MIALACQPICQPIRVDPIRVDLAPPLSQPVQVELAPPLSQPVQVELTYTAADTAADSPMARYLWGLIAGGVGLVVLAWVRPAYWPFKRGRSPPRTDRGR